MTHPLNPQFNQGTRSEEGPASKRPYRGRFAPSPTGPLHLGSLATALGSWLDARAHGGTWLVRIEDVDVPRTVPGADRLILDQLQACGLEWDEAPVWQSQRTTHYQNALEQLITIDRIYGCKCSRKQIEEVLQKEGVLIKPNQELIYPGTCRERKVSIQNHALRIRLPHECQISFSDRRIGKQTQDLNMQVGDFVLRRADVSVARSPDADRGPNGCGRRRSDRLSLRRGQRLGAGRPLCPRELPCFARPRRPRRRLCGALALCHARRRGVRRRRCVPRAARFRGPESPCRRTQQDRREFLCLGRRAARCPGLRRAGARGASDRTACGGVVRPWMN